MDENHVSRELMRRFFRGEPSGRDTRDVVRHLVRQCESCLKIALEVGAEEGYVYQEGDFQRAFTAKDTDRYDEVFRRLPGFLGEVQVELARERLRGIGLWHTLEKQDQERRLTMIRSDPRMHNWGLYDRLLETCREMSFRSPSSAIEVAELARAVAATLDTSRYGAGPIADFQAGALAALGNARRLASDFKGAESAFQEARQKLAEGTGDPLEEAHLIGLEASLLKDLGEFERAVVLLDQAVTLYRQLDDPHMEGRILVKQAATIGFVQPERAVELCQEALKRIDRTKEPRLEWCARHNLAHFLNDSGKIQEALAVLEDSRLLYAQFKDVWTRIRKHWLEGKIARSLGDLAEAEETFKRLWYDLQEPSYAHELTLLSLDLAEVYVARGKHEEAVELIEDLAPLLRGWGMHREGMALWLLMQKAVQERRAKTDLFQRMAEYLNRAWFRPLREHSE